MLIRADLVLRIGSFATLHADGCVTANAYDLLPGSRVYLPNSQVVVRVTKNEDGFTEAVRESDNHPCLLRRSERYDVVSEVRADTEEESL